MKKYVLLSLLFCMVLGVFAQSEVTKFLGIPVDGTKQEMIAKLKAKGFKASQFGDLEGKFNGQDVYVSVVTNNDKVYRVALVDETPLSETDIKIRFNTLCRQFENNGKYISYEGNQSLSEEEDISYEMAVHNKRYQAVYYQCMSSENQADCQLNSVWFMIREVYGKYGIVMFYDNERNQANGEDL
ncbi:MAG: hypothetical protein ACI30A_02100 [Paludibacteraceae bacterium]